jgi:hypothetical protein
MGVIGWAVYGYKIRAQSMIYTNGVTALLALSILVYKCIYG